MSQDKFHSQETSDEIITETSLCSEAAYKEQRMIDTGKRIKEARLLNNMTQQQLASKIGKTESSIRKYEKGIVNIPLGVLEDIAQIFNMPSEKLLYGSEEIKHKEQEIARIDTLLRPLNITVGVTELLSAIGYTVTSPTNPYKRIAPSPEELLKKTFIDSPEFHIEMDHEDYTKLQQDIVSYVHYLIYKYNKEHPN